MSNFGERLKARRLMLRLSQNELSKRSGVSQQAISGIESGRNSPSEQTILMLSAALHCSLSELMQDGDVIAGQKNNPAPDSRDGIKNEIISLLDDLQEDEQIQARDYLEWILSRRGK